LRDARDGKERLLVPVRNEIAHVREVGNDRLLRASVACADDIRRRRLLDALIAEALAPDEERELEAAE
jgi:hypothetical protein